MPRFSGIRKMKEMPYLRIYPTISYNEKHFYPSKEITQRSLRNSPKILRQPENSAYQNQIKTSLPQQSTRLSQISEIPDSDRDEIVIRPVTPVNPPSHCDNTNPCGKSLGSHVEPIRVKIDSPVLLNHDRSEIRHSISPSEGLNSWQNANIPNTSRK